MPLINGSPIIGYLRAFRMCVIDGRYGGGKTALSFRLAYELLKNHGYKYLITNLPSPWRDDRENIIPDANGALNSVVILDEAGLFLDDPRAAKKFQAALRKLNCVVIMPSVTPVSSRVKFVSIRREANLTVIGLPAWVYKSVVNNDTRNPDYFIWWRPSEIFGVYGTNHYPIDDRGIARYLNDSVNTFKERYADVRPYADSLVSGSEASSDDQGAAVVLEAAEIIQSAVGAIPITYTKRR